MPVSACHVFWLWSVLFLLFWSAVAQKLFLLITGVRFTAMDLMDDLDEAATFAHYLGSPLGPAATSEDGSTKGSVSAKKGKAKAKASGKGRSNGVAKQLFSADGDEAEQEAEFDQEKRKCNSICKKEKPVEEFHLSSASCKDCRSKVEACERRLIKLGKGEELKKVKANNPKGYERVIKFFDKECPKDMTKYNRRSESCALLQLWSEVVAETGTTTFGRYKMM